MSPCPSRQRLRDYLDERLSGEKSLAVEAHVEGCPPCQAALERLTEAGTETAVHLSGWGGVMANPSPASRGRQLAEAGAEFLRRLEQNPPPAEATWKLASGSTTDAVASELTVGRGSL